MRKKIRNSRSFILFLVVAVSMAAQGCKKSPETPPPASPAPPVSQQPKPVQKPVSTAKGATSGGTVTVPSPVQKQSSSARRAQTAAVNTFDFSAKKDPFKPLISPQAAAPKAVAPAPTRRSTAELLPIQSYETEKFKVTGIIVGLRENSALVIDPTGKGYVVKEGTHIGSNEGYVTKITPTALEVIEKFNDEKGKVRKRTIKLTLSRKTKESSR